MPLAGVLFDKDGTLVDFDLTWGRAAHAVMTGLGADDAVRLRRLADSVEFELLTRRFATTSPFIGGSMADVATLWGDVLGRRDDPGLLAEVDAAFAVETLAALSPVGDPAAVLTVLRRQGLRLGLATNDGEASARQQIATLGLDQYLDYVAGYDSGHGSKPGSGMVLAFAAALDVSPHRVALVGDTPHDMQAARAAGAVAIAVLTGPLKRDSLQHLADYTIDSIADLPSLFATLP